MKPDKWQQLGTDYRALNAPDTLNAAVLRHQQAATAQTNRQRWLTLAAGLVTAALLALWLAPTSTTVRSADNAPSKTRLSMSLPSPSSLSVTRPLIDASTRRTPRFSTLRTPARPKNPIRKKE